MENILWKILRIYIQKAGVKDRTSWYSCNIFRPWYKSKMVFLSTNYLTRNASLKLLECLLFVATFHIRRGLRLPQRSHLRTLKNFVSEKSGKHCEKLGKYLIKSGNRENFEDVHFFSCIRACKYILQSYIFRNT